MSGSEIGFDIALMESAAFGDSFLRVKSLEAALNLASAIMDWTMEFSRLRLRSGPGTPGLLQLWLKPEGRLASSLKQL
jgi:hypothetical protein